MIKYFSNYLVVMSQNCQKIDGIHYKNNTNSKFETRSEKSKLQLECIPHTTSYRSCLFIQPAVEAKKFVQFAGTE